MAKVYDPVMCMMVEEGTKTTDAQKHILLVTSTMACISLSA